MQRAWIQDMGDEGVAFVHAASGQDLDTLATYAREMGEAQRPGSDFKLAATVDQAVIIDWCNQRGVTFQRFMHDGDLQNRFLDDPVNAPFRVWRGRI